MEKRKNKEYNLYIAHYKEFVSEEFVSEEFVSGEFVSEECVSGEFVSEECVSGSV